MPQTPSAIVTLSPRLAARSAVKVLPQTLKDETTTFASLLGAEKPAAKAGSVSKKHRSGTASSSAKAHEDTHSLSASDEAASNTAEKNVASSAPLANQPNQGQFIPGGALPISLAPYMPISVAEKDSSVAQSSASADPTPTRHSSRPSAQLSQATKEFHSRSGPAATAAQLTQTGKSSAGSYETLGDQQASHTQVAAKDRTITPAASSSPVVDTAANSSGTPPAPNPAPFVDTAVNSSGTPPALNPAPAVTMAAKDPEIIQGSNLASTPSSAAKSPETPLTFNSARASNMAPKSPETPPTLNSGRTATMAAKRSETPSLPSLLSTANTESQNTGSRASNSAPSHEPASGLSASNAGDRITQGIAMPLPSAGAVKAPSPAVVVSSRTHFGPEAPRPTAVAGNATQIATGTLRQDQAEASGQAASSPSQIQLVSELSTVAAPPNDVQFKIAAPALASHQAETLQPKDYTPPRTKAASQAAQRLDTIANGSSFAEPQAENPVDTVSAPGLRVAATRRGGFSPDGSAKGTASHGNPASGPASSPAAVPGSVEVSPAIALGIGDAAPTTPAQQILDGIQRAIPAADNSQVLSGSSQPTLDGQQPLKTITIALSPASLGNVAVELSFKSGQLGVKLQVQEASTVQLLRQDRALEKLLESAGYAVQSLSIHLAPQPAEAPAQTTPNGQGFSNQFSSGGGGQEQGNSQSHKGQPADRNADQRPGYGRTEDVRGGSSLYV